MPRQIFNFKTKKWETPEEAQNAVNTQETKTTIINDEIEPTVHPCDGKTYTSSTKFRATTKAHDCVEYGDQLPSEVNPRRREAIDGDVREVMQAWEAVIGNKKDRGTEDERRAQEMEVLERLGRD